MYKTMHGKTTSLQEIKHLLDAILTVIRICWSSLVVLFSCHSSGSWLEKLCTCVVLFFSQTFLNSSSSWAYVYTHATFMHNSQYIFNNILKKERKIGITYYLNYDIYAVQSIEINSSLLKFLHMLT